MKNALHVSGLLAAALTLSILSASCGGDDNMSTEEVMVNLCDHVWETDPERDYFITGEYVERDVDRFFFYFYGDGSGVARQHHYNFDYIGSSHTSSDDAWRLNYRVNGSVVTVNEGGGDYDYLLTNAGGVMRLERDGQRYYARDYTTDDREFLNDWKFVTDDTQTDSSQDYGFAFDFKVGRVMTSVTGSKKEWWIRAEISSDKLSSRSVNWLQAEVGCSPGRITNKKEYGTVGAYPNGGSCQFLINTNGITDDKIHSWSFSIYAETQATCQSLTLTVIPAWTSSVQGEIIGNGRDFTVYPDTEN